MSQQYTHHASRGFETYTRYKVLSGINRRTSLLLASRSCVQVSPRAHIRLIRVFALKEFNLKFKQIIPPSEL